MELLTLEPLLPQPILNELERYVAHYAPPCWYLAAVISNDLMLAIAVGKPEQVAILPSIVAWLIKHCPAKAIGSADRYRAWVAKYDDGLPF